MCFRRSVPGRQPSAMRLRTSVVGPVAAQVAARVRASAHTGHGRDAGRAADGPKSDVRGPPQRGRPRPGSRHLPGGPEVQGERAERQRHRQHCGQDVAPDRVPGPFAGGLLPGHRVVQRILNAFGLCKKRNGTKDETPKCKKETDENDFIFKKKKKIYI